ncbi:DUF4232 domain-containing protein [Streptomyces sp. NBC_00289]|uniref:DUF4232 domain-containing protein n=1 Tax=Streptomyces sp. NBC_00289 TaxID=2975703 RepID=UPI003246B41F
MATRLRDAALCVVAGIAATSLIWTVGDLTYDDPSARNTGEGASRESPGPGPGPEPSEACSTGIRVTAGPVDAAMGLRAMDVTLLNCGTDTYRVKGYPGLRLLDDDQQTVTGVSMIHGSGGITGLPGFDDPPRAVSLRPGETATAGLVWRNTVTDVGGPVDVPYLTVEARPGALPLLVTPDGGLDLGTTGRLGVSAWRATAPDAS